MSIYEIVHRPEESGPIELVIEANNYYVDEAAYHFISGGDHVASIPIRNTIIIKRKVDV